MLTQSREGAENGTRSLSLRPGAQPTGNSKQYSENMAAERFERFLAFSTDRGVRRLERFETFFAKIEEATGGGSWHREGVSV